MLKLCSTIALPNGPAVVRVVADWLHDAPSVSEYVDDAEPWLPWLVSLPLSV